MIHGQYNTYGPQDYLKWRISVFLRKYVNLPCIPIALLVLLDSLVLLVEYFVWGLKVSGCVNRTRYESFKSRVWAMFFFTCAVPYDEVLVSFTYFTSAIFLTLSMEVILNGSKHKLLFTVDHCFVLYIPYTFSCRGDVT